MEEEMLGFYSQNLTFSQIVNICFEVNAIYVADSNCGMELRFFLTFIKRVFGYTTAETIEHISDAILHEEDGVNVVTSASTEWLSVSTAGGGRVYCLFEHENCMRSNCSPLQKTTTGLANRGAPHTISLQLHKCQAGCET